MKVTIEYEFNTIYDIDDAIKRIEKLVKDHVENNECHVEVPLLNCSELKDLWWLHNRFQRLKEKVENTEIKPGDD